MEYRVKFRTKGPMGGIYYTEWFDTKDEAIAFLDEAEYSGLDVLLIEDEIGNVV